MDWVWHAVNFVIKMINDIEHAGRWLEWSTYVADFLIKSEETQVKQFDTYERDVHCKGCLYKHPVLLQLLKDKIQLNDCQLLQNPEYLKRLEKYDEIPDSCTDEKDDLIDNYKEFEINYSEEFLLRCRSPQFLQDQLNKIEAEYKTKMSHLQECRDKQLQQHQTRYKIVKNEVLKDFWC